jgi:hypothetical protein
MSAAVKWPSATMAIEWGERGVKVSIPETPKQQEGGERPDRS